MPQDNRERPTVLVMDDAPEHREYAKAFLESEGYRVNLASTMKGAINAIHNGQDLMVALIDIHMHGTLAHDVFGYIKRTASHRVVGYGWTGDTRQATHLEAVRAGAFRIFNKGIDSDELILEYMKSDIELVRAYGEDDLTGLYNTRSFRRAALEDMKTMREHGQPGVASLVFIDIDDFKQVNDEHGHLVGDDAIRAIGRAARAHVRPGDHLCRKGGDEFLILTPGLGGSEALTRARRIQSTIAATTVSDKDGRTVALSVSVGVADMRSGDLGGDLEADLKGLIGRADEGKNTDKLTKARRRGRPAG
jgi:diguanylate cyclase (GGDEF)-like protein